MQDHRTIAAELAGFEDAGIVPLPGAGRQRFGNLIGFSPVMQALYERIEHAAPSRATVFITGESGTGKELCAEILHRLSPRADKAFIPINCAAIPRDLLESELFGHVKGAFTGAISDRDGAASLADGGTLFLDEVAEMTPEMQTKLLRFLQDFTFRKVGGGKLEKTDVRIICATNRNPGTEIAAGRFREDLFYRLYVIPLHMPPLRDRGDDVSDIAIAFLRRFAAEERKRFTGLSEEAEATLRRYEWPGNVRQLQNVMRHTAVMFDGDIVTARMLAAAMMPRAGTTPLPRPDAPAPVAGGGTAAHPLIRPLADVEREAIEAAINQCAGNIPQAAALLAVAPSTLYRKKMAWETGTPQDPAPPTAP